MRITRIYHPQTVTLNKTITLPKDASHHLITVLRAKLNTPIQLFDGNGLEYKGYISAITKKQAELTLTEKINTITESPLQIHLAQAITNSEKMDWIIQKSVELGVNVITPVITEFGNTKIVANKLEKKLEHWQKVIISACEQSGRSHLATINPPLTLSQFISSNKTETTIFCSPRASQTIQQLPKPNKSITIIIGPEGGFSDSEVQQMQTNNCMGVLLGPRILRTETASLALISVLQSHWGDWS